MTSLAESRSAIINKLDEIRNAASMNFTVVDPLRPKPCFAKSREEVLRVPSIVQRHIVSFPLLVPRCSKDVDVGESLSGSWCCLRERPDKHPSTESSARSVGTVR
jgi:hypothetical protein